MGVDFLDRRVLAKRIVDGRKPASDHESQLRQGVALGHPQGRSAAKEPQSGLTRRSPLTFDPTCCGFSHSLFAIYARFYAAVNRPPYAPLTSSEAIRDALRNAYRRSDLVPPGGQVRTHALRHGLAMALLDRGSSLAEIGDVLRHRCARSTTAYARYDHGALRPLARPWPVPGGGR